MFRDKQQLLMLGKGSRVEDYNIRYSLYVSVIFHCSVMLPWFPLPSLVALNPSCIEYNVFFFFFPVLQFYLLVVKFLILAALAHDLDERKKNTQ